jgi:hypothetical protein
MVSYIILVDGFFDNNILTIELKIINFNVIFNSGIDFISPYNLYRNNFDLLNKF